MTLRFVRGTALLFPGLILAAAACAGADGSASSEEAPAADGRLFTKLPSSYTGVRFANHLEETRELNVFTYRNFYNGGGVGIGDLNNDGLPEVMLTSNLGGNRLYLNQGKLRFRDITDAAGVEGTGDWATGVTFADVNGDGLLDIYVCYAGNVAGEKRANELYINNGASADGVPTFSEKAADYGIADQSYTTHAAFFDYDRDGRLDLFLVNNSFRPVSSFGLRNIRHVRNALGGHKLYHNGGTRFVDVSEKAGIFGSEIGFGLGVAVGDLNRDALPDIYVSNDFFERDYLYINKGDGTFAEVLDEQMPSISMFSMGLDMADINNDGLLDVYVTDMLPEDNYRLKMTSQFESWDVYQAKLKNDYHHQFMRNMLHLNNGNATFSEIGQMAGVARTDWSWSALIADFDLDGHKDIHVTNGIARDLTSQDYISFLANDETMRAAMQTGKRVDFLRLINAMEQTPLPDYAFRNNGDLTFTKESAAWGIDQPNFSNGAAYGDLDRDGDIDLVVNNINEEAFVYRNNARAQSRHRFLQVVLEGEAPNRFAIGAKVTVRSGDTIFFQELMPSRGFQSSVDYVLTFGVGARDTLDTVEVVWPDKRISALRNVAANQRVTLRQREASPAIPPSPKLVTPLFANVTDEIELGDAHRENRFVDFDRERLAPKMVSMEGPFMAVADVNGDGLDDVYIGGAKDQGGQLLMQQRTGRFVSTNRELLAEDRISEDLGAAFFHANGDGHRDLYVVSGGSDFSDVAPALEDRLYINDGRGRFRKTVGQIPSETISGSRVVAADYDRDGDVDLFVGGRVIPGRYGIDPQSTLLQNNGRGRFTDVTQSLAPELARVGMVTDALWIDLTGDDRLDLVLVGEWMPVTAFRNVDGGKLEKMELEGLEKSHGWWNRIVPGDFNGDGRTDFIVGNLGLNARLVASESRPVTMYVKDFDKNGFGEHIISYYIDSVSYPLVLRDDLIKTLPYLKSRYLNYKDYAEQKVSDIFTAEELADAVVKQAYTFATAMVRNDGDGAFTLVPLPIDAQKTAIYGILPVDFDRDGALDLLLAGNFDGVKPEFGRVHAGYGVFLRNDGKGAFLPVPATESGFFVPGQVRDIQRLRTPNGESYVVARNSDRALVFRAARKATLHAAQ